MTTSQPRQPETNLTPSYYLGESNRYPGCGRRHWWIGRHSAKCAFCATALPLDTATAGSSIIRRRAA